MEFEAGSLLVLVLFLPPVLYRSKEMQPLVALQYQITWNVVSQLCRRVSRWITNSTHIYQKENAAQTAGAQLFSSDIIGKVDFIRSVAVNLPDSTARVFRKRINKVKQKIQRRPVPFKRVNMKNREYSTRISAAMDDFKEFVKSQIEEFKNESEKLLARKIEELNELAAGDSTGQAEFMQTTGQAQMQKSPQSEPELEHDGSDSSLMNWIQSLEDVGAGSTVDEVDSLINDVDLNFEVEQERYELISSDNEGESKEIKDAQLEGFSTLGGPRKSRRTVKEPAWMKDFITVGKNEEEIEGTESEDQSTLGGARLSRRTAKEPAWMKDFMTD